MQRNFEQFMENGIERKCVFSKNCLNHPSMGDLSICELWCLWGVLEPISHGYKRRLYVYVYLNIYTYTHMCTLWIFVRVLEKSPSVCSCSPVWKSVHGQCSRRPCCLSRLRDGPRWPSCALPVAPTSGRTELFLPVYYPRQRKEIFGVLGAAPPPCLGEQEGTGAGGHCEMVLEGTLLKRQWPLVGDAKARGVGSSEGLPGCWNWYTSGAGGSWWV